MRLLELNDGDSARVARISEVAEHEAPQLLRLLDDRGIVPGIEVGVVSHAATGWNLKVAGATVTVDPATARAIWVEAPQSD